MSLPGESNSGLTNLEMTAYLDYTLGFLKLVLFHFAPIGTIMYAQHLFGDNQGYAD